MKTVEKFTSALGEPQVLREIVRNRRPLAAVGRWRHQGAKVNLGDIDIVQLVFNVSDGQRVELRGNDRLLSRTVRAGSIGIVAPGVLDTVAVTGRADTIQIILSQEMIRLAATATANPSTGRSIAREWHLQRASVQALVVLAGDPQKTSAALEKIVLQVACFLAAKPPLQPTGPRACSRYICGPRRGRSA